MEVILESWSALLVHKSWDISTRNRGSVHMAIRPFGSWPGSGPCRYGMQGHQDTYGEKERERERGTWTTPLT